MAYRVSTMKTRMSQTGDRAAKLQLKVVQNLKSGLFVTILIAIVVNFERTSQSFRDPIEALFPVPVFMIFNYRN